MPDSTLSYYAKVPAGSARTLRWRQPLSLLSLLNPVNEWLDPEEMSSPKRTTSRAASHEKDLEVFGGDGSPYPSEGPDCRLFSLCLLELGVSVRIRERERGEDATGDDVGRRGSIDAGRWKGDSTGAKRLGGEVAESPMQHRECPAGGKNRGERSGSLVLGVEVLTRQGHRVEFGRPAPVMAKCWMEGVEPLG